MYKISANIVCKNERHWLRESISSIVNLVDEIIYVDDNSKDGSLKIAKDLSKKYDNIKVFESSSHKLNNLCDLKNYAMRKSKNDMVIRWDADFIAYKELDNLLTFALENIEKYDAYVLITPNLQGNINYYLKGKEYFGPEIYLYKKSKMIFKQNDRYNDYPVFDKSTKYCYPNNTSLSRNHFFIHTNKLKSYEKLAYRKRMTEYQINVKDGRTYWEWLSDNSKLTPVELKEKEIDNIKNEVFCLEKFDFEKWGAHPKILTESKSCDLFKVKQFKKGFKIVAPD